MVTSSVASALGAETAGAGAGVSAATFEVCAYATPDASTPSPIALVATQVAFERLLFMVSSFRVFIR